MKQNIVITFALFIFSQIMLWIISQEDNIMNGAEVFGLTTFTGLFLALFFAGFRWSRWVVASVLSVLGCLLIAVSLDFGAAFSGVACLYAAVIFMLFRHSAPVEVAIEKNSMTLNAEALDSPHTGKQIESVVNGFSVGDEVYHFPLLLKRYQSLLIDGLLLFFTMVVTMVILDESPYRQVVMITMGAVFLFVYEPLLTAYSATMGQRVMGIRVRHMENPDVRINIVQAYVRVIVKWCFGWLSFVTINFNPAHRAIHDMAGNSVVIRLK